MSIKSILILAFLFLPACASYAQRADEVLASANGLTFTPASLPENTRKLYLDQNATIAAERSKLAVRMLREKLIDVEAKSAATTAEGFLAAEMKKVSDPPAAELKAVYDANRSSIGDRTFDEVRPQLVAFLRNNAEQKAFAELSERLKTKYKYAAGKDINAPDLKPADVLFSIDGKPVTAGEFDNRFKADLYDLRAEIAVQTRFDLENVVFSTLVAQEAKSRSIEPGDLIAAEVTNKLRDFSNEERLGLENDLKKRLFEKYAVKISLKEPEPVAHDVSVDDDPASGKATAPVTVVMFSDFQCSACSATHPVLKQAMAGYGDKVRLVVRDFPLESIHENSFAAARAANAAGAQGKFFEYIEVLYHNQDKLDAASLKAYAAELGLNAKQFELDFTSEKTAAEIRKDMADGAKYGVRGTPGIFINGVKVFRLSADGFRAAIDRALLASTSK